MLELFGKLDSRNSSTPTVRMEEVGLERLFVSLGLPSYKRKPMQKADTDLKIFLRFANLVIRSICDHLPLARLGRSEPVLVRLGNLLRESGLWH